MSIRLGNSVIASGTASDNKSITANASNELQTIGVINQNAQNVALKSWMGTLAEYNALVNSGDVDENTIYNITDDMEGGESVYTKEEVDEGFLATNKITNCITEIPQDIKLELADGTLTLKAGSKVYVPNGFEADGVTPKFDEVVLESDVTATSSGTNGASLVYYTTSYGSPSLVFSYLASDGGSGTTPPTNGVYYNLSTNQINFTNSGTIQDQRSLPLGIVQRNNPITSIDQVFNGFGYIGSTVFALPGVKGLIPNGRNADGSLRNTEFTVSNVLTFTNPFGAQNVYLITDGEQLGLAGKGWTHYNSERNTLVDDLTGSDFSTCVFGTAITQADNRFTSFTPKQTFHALDYNDSSTIAGWAMPSNRYVDLTLGASGTTYTAPANGWVFFAKASGSSGQFNSITNSTSGGLRSDCDASNSGRWATVNCPVKKGDIFSVEYTTSGETKRFRFIYAEGEE